MLLLRSKICCCIWIGFSRDQAQGPHCWSAASSWWCSSPRRCGPGSVSRPVTQRGLSATPHRSPLPSSERPPRWMRHASAAAITSKLQKGEPPGTRSVRYLARDDPQCELERRSIAMPPTCPRAPPRRCRYPQSNGLDAIHKREVLDERECALAATEHSISFARPHRARGDVPGVELTTTPRTLRAPLHESASGSAKRSQRYFAAGRRGRHGHPRLLGQRCLRAGLGARRDALATPRSPRRAAT